MTAGGIAIGIAMILVIPVGTMLLGAIWSLLMGSSLLDDARHSADSVASTLDATGGSSGS